MRRRERFEKLFESDGDKLDGDSTGQVTGVAESYPLLRRAARLSYAIWAVIPEEGAQLQRVLEETSIARGCAAQFCSSLPRLGGVARLARGKSSQRIEEFP
jgi:hypothetical protein